MERIIKLIDRTTSLLENSTAEYEKVKKDSKLRYTFHQAGEGLALVKSSLETVKSHLQTPNLGGGSDGAKVSINACKGKATSSEWIFRKVAEAPENARFGAYNSLLAQNSRLDTVEVLVQGMMKDVCELVKQSGIEEKMRDEVEDLRDAINEFENMASVDTEGKGGNITHYGDGDQFNALGGEQNNNTGDGNQFPGAIFHGQVNMGDKVPEKPIGPHDPHRSG